jgi:hypothetical protein
MADTKKPAPATKKPEPSKKPAPAADKKAGKKYYRFPESQRHFAAASFSCSRRETSKPGPRSTRFPESRSNQADVIPSRIAYFVSPATLWMFSLSMMP